MANTVSFNRQFPSIEISDLIYKKMINLVPSCTQTLAKGPGQYVRGVAPKFLFTGKGSHVWDVDGNEYIDLNMGIGPLSLGYCYDTVDKAIVEQLGNGITFSMMHPLEAEVAGLINHVVPNADMVKFSKTGCDVTSAAIRLARAYTGREKVLCCGYHGWHDWYISVTDRNAGIPKSVNDQVYTFDYNDIESVEDSIDENTACIILEPVVFEEPRDNFLMKLRELCDRTGTLLIFDEMWTGFRLHIGGAQKYYGVDADLACFSKAIANGMPLSALTGKRDIMQLLEKDVFFYTTFGGEALSLAAAKATIETMIQKDVSTWLSSMGERLKAGYNGITKELGIDYSRCIGPNVRSMVTFDKSAGDPLEMKSLVQQELIKRGIIWSGFHNMCYTHSDRDIDHILEAYKEALVILNDAVEDNNVKTQLRGEVVEPVFRKTGNFNTKPKTGAAA